MRSHVLAICLALWTVVSFAQDKQAYIKQYLDIAVSEMHRTGIPASIKLSQAILESSYGRSQLAREAHNHFGIKCGRAWNGRGYSLKDDDYDSRGQLVHSCFRAFKSPDESYIAHSEFLMDQGKSGRYGFLFALPPDDYKGWAHGLQKAGYATNPQYAKLLIRIIEEEKLYSYDTRRLDDDLATKYLPNAHPEVRDGMSEYDAYMIRFQNDIPYIVVRNGDDVKKISKRVDVPARKIVRYNTVVDHKRVELEEGDRIYLQPMKRKYHGDQKTHRVDIGETVDDIAHNYAIKSTVLRKRNNLPDDCEPAPGSVLVLRGKQKNQIRCATEQTILASAPVRSTPPERPNPVTPPAAEASSAEPRTETVIVQTASAPASDIFMHQLLSYTVQPKDTLFQIATKHGISVTELKKINNLTTDVIHPGLELKVKK